MAKIKWQDNPQDYRKLTVPEQDIEWVKEKDKKYKYHMTLHHKPTGMAIEQAGERCWTEVKELCLQNLKWRLTHWDEYVASRVRPVDAD